MTHKNKPKFSAIMLITYVACALLVVLSLVPFAVMFANATRSTPEIQQRAFSLIPSTSLKNNFFILSNGTFDSLNGLKNSFIISVSATVCAIYFSTLTTSLFIFNQAFSGSYMYARAAAASMILFVIIGAASVVIFFLMRDRAEALAAKRERQRIRNARRQAKLAGRQSI